MKTNFADIDTKSSIIRHDLNINYVFPNGYYILQNSMDSLKHNRLRHSYVRVHLWI